MMSDMRMKRTLTLLAVLAAGSAASLLGQDQAQRVRDAYPPEAAAEIQALVEEAGRNGVPTMPLYDKALEGAAKRVPAARVIPALREYSGRMGRAQGFLGGTREAAWVVAGADALRRGVESDALTSIGREAGARTPMALVVMGDLVEAGVPAGRAMEVLQEALTRTTGEDGLLEVPTALRRLVREGALAPDAAGDMLNAMRDGVDLRRVHHRATRPHRRASAGTADPTGLRSDPGQNVGLEGDGRRLFHEPVAEPALDPLQPVHQQPRLTCSRKPVGGPRVAHHLHRHSQLLQGHEPLLPVSNGRPEVILAVDDERGSRHVLHVGDG